MSLNSESFNGAIKAWGAEALAQLQSTGSSLGISHRDNSPSKGDSLKSIRDKYAIDNSGFITKISFTTINRSLLYTSAGAGKGRGGVKGSRWIDKHGNRKSTNPASLGKAGSGGRSAKPFIDITLDSDAGVEALANIVAEQSGDTIINNVYVK